VNPPGRTWTTASPAPQVDLTPAAPTTNGGGTDVTFVLVTYGTGRVVVDSIAAAARAASAASVSTEVVVVDNPHPTEPNRARRHLALDTRGVRIVEPTRNLGFGGGCELGILHARSPSVCLLNPDVTDHDSLGGELDDGWLATLLGALDEPGVSIVAPVLLDSDGGVQEAGQRIGPDGWTAAGRLPSVHGVVDVDFASAACWLMRRDEHERLGGFDAAFHPAYFEDADLAFRARSLGGRVVVHTDARLVHLVGTGTPGAADPTFQHDRFVARWPAIRWGGPDDRPGPAPTPTRR
jgi:GT2 family glycosyltransferase